MNASVQNIIDYMNSNNVKYDVEYYEDRTVFSLGYSISNGSIRIKVIVNDKGSTAALRCYTICKCPEDKVASMLKVCNKFNNQYKWVKFLIDDDSDVCAENDALINPSTAGDDVTTLIYFMVDIIDKIYPEAMRVIWG